MWSNSTFNKFLFGFLHFLFFLLAFFYDNVIVIDVNATPSGNAIFAWQRVVRSGVNESIMCQDALTIHDDFR